MRILGLDYGSKTIGVSLSDPLKITARGLEIINRDNEESLKASLKRIDELIKSYDIEKIVLGFPKNMNNTLGPRCEKTLVFKEKLEKRFGIEVVIWDERLSTISATRTLLEADVSRKKRKKVIDKMAATIILQNYLDSVR